MKKIKLKFLGIFLLFFVAAVTPSCEVLIDVLDAATQVDNNSNDNNNNNDDNNNNNNNDDGSGTSKGKGQG